MFALISEILVCLLAAAVVGFGIAWFLRMGQVAELRAETRRLRATVPTGVLPSALSTRLELLARLMEEVKARPVAESSTAVDLTPVLQKIETLCGGSSTLSSRLAAVSKALTALSPDDLSGLERRLDGLATAVEELRNRPAPPVDLGLTMRPSLPHTVDLSGIERRLDALSAEIAVLHSRHAAH